MPPREQPLQPSPVDAPPRRPAPEFYIPATSSILERRPRTLKHDDLFAVFDHYGDVLGSERSPEGLFHGDTRHLSHLRLTLNGRRPLLMSSTVQDDNALLAVDLANPDISRGGRLVLRRDTIHIGRTKFLWRDVCYERLRLRNFGLVRHRVRLRIDFAADFADVFEVRGHPRPRRGTLEVDQPAGNTVRFRYEGIDGVERTTAIAFDPEPSRLTNGAAVFDVVLDPGARTAIFVTVVCGGAEPRPPRFFFPCLRDSRRTMRRSAADKPTVETSNELFNEMLCRALADLRMLITETPHGPYPYAGIPWFSTAFGRDGIITALEMHWLDPSIARGVLDFLAATQAQEENPESEATPGKIVHETRTGEMARLGEVPFRRYYGSVDVTPLFVMLAGMHHERTGDLDTVERLWPNIVAALDWIDGEGDSNGDGFVDYDHRGGGGLANQGWKDSDDSVFHADGGLPPGPIALCEVQGYVFAAKRAAARLARALGRKTTATILEREAAILGEKFDQAFWCEDLGTYALALDGDGRQCRIKTSNAGHALFTGIAGTDRAARVAQTLLGHDSFSGWGVRTVAAGEARYNPMSYHNGSVWPHDNALIALGFVRYGLKTAATRIVEGITDAANYMDLRRLPELFCGFPRRTRHGPTLYPVACWPQAWASAAPFAFLQACLGIECDHSANVVRLTRPMLPAFLDEVCIRGLRLGESRVDLLLRRYRSDVAVNVIARDGDVRVIVLN